MHSVLSGKGRKWPLSCRKGPHPARALLVLLLLAAAGPLCAQSITLSVKEAPFESVLRQVGTQAGHQLVYTHETVQKGKPVTLTLKKAPLRKALDRLFEDQSITYLLQGGHIIVKAREEKQAVATTHHVSGTVTDEAGAPLAGVTVGISGTARATATDGVGYFILRAVPPDAILVFSSVGYETRALALNGQTNINVQLPSRVNTLDETVVIAYGTTTRRLSTGNIARVSGEAISRQPVSNPLATLQGRVPGLLVSQSSGLPGAAFRIQVRGRNSIAQGSDPLFVIDGVPYAPGNSFLNQLSSAIGVTSSIPSFSSGLSPFNLINPLDIESIEVLKDADATAIYGSRGANGVILITTKKAKEGQTGVTASLSTGWSKITRSMPMLDTRQYLEMRREAFANDGLTPTTNPALPGYAPDLLLWDTTRQTNFRDLLLDGVARTSQAQVSLAGGGASTQFLLAGTYRRQTTVFPGNFNDEQGASHMQVSHRSVNKKFHSLLSANYSVDRNSLLRTDLSVYLGLPPILPPLYDSAGNLKWEDKGVTYPLGNPFSELMRTYRALSSNLISNLQLSYQIFPTTTLRSSFGYNTVTVDEKALNPKAAIDPQLSATGSSNFATSLSRSWIIEPQIEYANKLFKGKLNVLLGTTLQEIARSQNTQTGLNYTSDLLLESIASAGRVVATNQVGLYRYRALFGRLNYNISNRYLFNITGRRDASSRFGPGRQTADFGAVGAGWIFSSEKWMKKAAPLLSFGKLRASYGSSGNDQIGDYQYLDSWTSTLNPYQGIPGLMPTRLFNSDYSWEINRKLEGGLELGFFKDQVLLTTSWFRNRSSNQLVAYPLPIQTGFNSVNQNLDALIENRGWEVQLSFKTAPSKKVSGESILNLTRQRNKLVSFPGLASSSYARTYVEGAPLSVIHGYRYTGLDPATGVYSFEDRDKDNALSYPNDFTVLGHLDPGLYGGFSQSVRYKNLQLDVLLEGRRQRGRSYLGATTTSLPGQLYNQPATVLTRWQQPGDAGGVQRFTTLSSSAAAKAANYLALSDGVFSDASYIRGRNLSLSYELSRRWLTGLQARSGRIYLQAQNFFTLTDYEGADPETQNFYALPPLKVLAAGFSLTF